MKIYFYMPNFHGGGAEKINTMLANYFFENGHDVSIIVLDDIGPNKTLLNSSIKVISLNTSSKFLKWIFFPISLYKAYSFFKVRKGILISGIVFNNIQSGILRKLTKVKVIAVEHTVRGKNDSQKIFFKNIIKLFTKFYAKNVDHIVCVSKAVMKDFKDSFNIKTNNLSVIYNPTFIKNKFNIENRTQDDFDKVFNFAYVGRLVKLKNIIFLIKSFQKEFKANELVFLYIFGEGPLKNMLQDYIEMNKLSNKVFLKGYNNDLDKIFLNIDCLLMASDFEGFGNVIIEAGSYGIPSISLHDSGGPSEIIIHKNTGLLSSKSNYCQSMREVTKTIFKKDKIVEHAKRFTIEKIGKEYLDIIYKIY